VLDKDEDKEPYLTDWGKRYQGNALAVLKPGNTAKLLASSKFAINIGYPIVPQGGNTGLCGGATPDNTGDSVIILLLRLNQISEVDLSKTPPSLLGLVRY
jgi:FAD/FMN-containing dehydrogenase